jgi:hypothetical protein
VSEAEDRVSQIEGADHPEMRAGQTWDEIDGPGFVTVRSSTAAGTWSVYTSDGLASLDESAIRSAYVLRWYVVRSVDSDGTSWWLSANGSMVTSSDCRRFDTPEGAKHAELPRGWTGVVAPAPSPVPSDDRPRPCRAPAGPTPGRQSNGEL